MKTIVQGQKGIHFAVDRIREWFITNVLTKIVRKQKHVVYSICSGKMMRVRVTCLIHSRNCGVDFEAFSTRALHWKNGRIVDGQMHVRNTTSS